MPVAMESWQRNDAPLLSSAGFPSLNIQWLNRKSDAVAFANLLLLPGHPRCGRTPESLLWASLGKYLGVVRPEPMPGADLKVWEVARGKDWVILVCRRVESNDQDLLLLALQNTYGYDRVLQYKGNPGVADRALFGRALVIVGEHSQGFTNMVFMRPGCAVVEIRPDKDQNQVGRNGGMDALVCVWVCVHMHLCGRVHVFGRTRARVDTCTAPFLSRPARVFASIHVSSERSVDERLGIEYIFPSRERISSLQDLVQHEEVGRMFGCGIIMQRNVIASHCGFVVLWFCGFVALWFCAQVFHYLADRMHMRYYMVAGKGGRVGMVEADVDEVVGVVKIILPRNKILDI